MADLSDYARQQRNEYMRKYNASMSDEAKELKRQYQREYRKRPENKEKLKVYNANYWERKAQQAALSDNNVTDKTNVMDIAVTDQLPVTSCAYCQSEFTPKRSDAKFCSAACRIAYHRIKKSLNK
ncbi:MAG: hypothetical protein ACOCXH_13670 [Cyclobacteriaceae bacterium]